MDCLNFETISLHFDGIRRTCRGCQGSTANIEMEGGDSPGRRQSDGTGGTEVPMKPISHSRSELREPEGGSLGGSTVHVGPGVPTQE